MKKITASVLALLLGLAAFAGCTSSGDASSAPPADSPADNSTAAPESSSVPADEVTSEQITFVVPRGMECMDDMALWSAD